MNAPRTMKEAYIAELLGNLDGLVDRVESLPALITTAEERITLTVKALDEGGDKYRMAVTAFNEQAKADLIDYLDKKAGQAAAKTVEEQRAAIQEIARLAFRSESPHRMEYRPSLGSRLMEHGITALAASGLTATLVYLLLHAH